MPENPDYVDIAGVVSSSSRPPTLEPIKSALSRCCAHHNEYFTRSGTHFCLVGFDGHLAQRPVANVNHLRRNLNSRFPS
jgi:hypothetical protein